MSVLNRVLFALICFQLGVLLLFLPWSAFWERNFFLERFPELIPILLNPYFRGAVTGLGLLDIYIAGILLFGRQSSTDAARS